MVDQARDNKGLSRRIGFYTDFEGQISKIRYRMWVERRWRLKIALFWACATGWMVMIYAEMETIGRRMGLRRNYILWIISCRDRHSDMPNRHLSKNLIMNLGMSMVCILKRSFCL